MTFRLLVAVFSATPLASQNLSVPSDTLLAGITARGRLLAAYFFYTFFKGTATLA